MKTLTNQILITTLISVMCFCLACTSTKQEDAKVSVISAKAKSGTSHFTVTPSTYYSKFNFLVDSSGAVYYYCLRNTGFISNGDNGQFPSFVDLTPEQMVKLTTKNVTDFLKSNVLNDAKDAINISISSQKDSIISLTFDHLIKFLYDSTKNVDFQIRTTTIEENTVLKFKNRNAFYDPKAVVWDSTKVAFGANASSRK